MSKDEIRKRVWTQMEELGVARFPLPVSGRIPNFEGAREAAVRMADLDFWSDARTLKTNPDSPQRWAREMALREGKRVYMAVPRLRKAECFLELDPTFIKNPSRAATIKGAFAQGHPIRPEKVRSIDLVLAGSVAVDRKGGRVGKGGGYSDLEYALGRLFGFLTEETPVVTSVHQLQIIDDDIPMLRHDVPVDYFVTPKGARRTSTRHAKPEGIYWDLLGEERLGAIPILKEARENLGLG